MRQIFLAAAFFLFYAGRVLGYCGPPRLICAEYAHSDAVVEAKLIRTRHYFPKREDKQDWFIYTLQVTKTYKGQIEHEFRVHDDSGRAGFSWNRTQAYLLFLRRDKDGTWFLYGCGNSGYLRNAKRTIEVINSLPSRNGGLIQGSVIGAPLGPKDLRIRAEEISGQKSYEGKTDDSNQFKIHVPAGHYRIKAVLKGWNFEKDPILSYEDPADITIENGECAQIVFAGDHKLKLQN